MKKLFLKSQAFKKYSLGAFFLFVFAIAGISETYSQSVSPDAYVPTIDRDYADQFKSQVESEIQNVRNDNSLDPKERDVRIKLLTQSVSNVYDGVQIEGSFTLAFKQLKEKIQSYAPNVNVKPIIREYQNQFN